MSEDDELDFWGERLGIHCGGYNSEVDEQILAVAELVASEDFHYCDDIASKLGLSPQHVELIQYILASVRYPVRDGDKYASDQTPFEYGTSPRGLFAGNRERTNEFLEEMRKQVATWSPPPAEG